jgi:mevalonate kinase
MTSLSATTAPDKEEWAAWQGTQNGCRPVYLGTLQVASAFNKLYHLKLTTRGIMEYAFRGETLTPSQCGRMDQACAFGGQPVGLRFDGNLLHVLPLELATTLYFVIVDLKADKDTPSILRALQSAYHPSMAQSEVCQHAAELCM